MKPWVWVVITFILTSSLGGIVVGATISEFRNYANDSEIKLSAFEAAALEEHVQMLQAKEEVLKTKEAALKAEGLPLMRRHSEIYKKYSLDYDNGDRLNTDGTIFRAPPKPPQVTIPMPPKPPAPAAATAVQPPNKEKQ